MVRFTVQNVQNDPGGGVAVSEVVGTAAEASNTNWALGGILVVAVASYLAWDAHERINPTTITVQAQYVPLAGLIIVAGALERLLEPLSEVLLKTDADQTAAANDANTANAAGSNHNQNAVAVQPLADNAASSKATLGGKRTKRLILFWAIASIAGMAVSACFGLFLLGSVATVPVNNYLDIVVTGLAIGAGTKPLHDLITTIQAKADASSNA